MRRRHRARSGSRSAVEPRGPPSDDAASGSRARRGALERRAAALAQVGKFGDPVLKSAPREVDELRPRAARRGRADDRDHARRDGRRPGRHPARRHAPPARLPGRARRDARRRSSTPRSSGSRTRSRSPRRAASACRGVSVDVERPLHARVSGRDVDGRADHDRGLGPRGARAPARDRPPRRRADPRPHDPRAAQGRAAGAARGRQLQPRPGRTTTAERRRASSTSAPTREDRLPRDLGVRRHGPARLADSRTGPLLVVTPPDRRRGRGRRARRRRRPPRRRASWGSSCSRPTSVNDAEALGADPRGARPRSGVVCAFGQLIREPLLSELRDAERASLAAAALARRRADRAGDHGRRRAHRGDDHAGRPRGSTPGPVALQRGGRDRARARTSARSRRGSPSSAASCWSRALDLRERRRARVRPSRTSARPPTRRRSTRPSAASTRPARRPSWSATVRALTPHVGAYLELDGGERLGRRARPRPRTATLEPGELAAEWRGAAARLRRRACCGWRSCSRPAASRCRPMPTCAATRLPSCAR